MFPAYVKDSPFVGGDADEVFSSVQAYREQPNWGDVSLLTTMRVLMCPRGGMNFWERSGTLNKGTMDLIRVRNEDVARNLSSRMMAPDEMRVLDIQWVTGKEEWSSLAKYLDDVKFCKNFLRGFAEDKAVERYLDQQGFAGKLYVARDRVSAILLLRYEGDGNAPKGLRALHLIQSLIPRYFPAVFEDQPLTEDEMELLKSLTEGDEKHYLDMINKLAESIDVRGDTLRRKLGPFEESLVKNQIDAVINRIDRVEVKLKELRESVENLLASREELLEQHLGLEEKRRAIQKKGDTESELLDFFLKNKGLDLVDTIGSRLYFTVKTVIHSYDPDAFVRMYNRESSILYTTAGRCGMEYEDVRTLFGTLFLTEQLRVRTCSAYTLSMRRGSVGGVQDFSFSESTLKTYLPNPHIQRFGCLGMNEAQIIASLEAGDMVGAVQGCIAAAGNISMIDATVFEHFVADLANPTCGKVIEAPDGELMTPREAIAWLRRSNTEEE